MDKNDTGTGAIPESELIALLASLKVEPAPEADFEGRFLHDLRNNLARETVCCPARRLLWDHIVQMFANFGPRKLAYGASTLGLGALAIGFFILPDEADTAEAVAAAASPASAVRPLSRMEYSLSALRFASAREAEPCTSIKVCSEKQEPYTEANHTSRRFFASFERGAAAARESVPVNMGLDAHELDAIPSFTTALDF